MQVRKAHESPDFQRAFVAVSFLLSVRDGERLLPFSEPTPEACSALARLQDPERALRARALASELQWLSRKLDGWRIA